MSTIIVAVQAATGCRTSAAGANGRGAGKIWNYAGFMALAYYRDKSLYTMRTDALDRGKPASWQAGRLTSGGDKKTGGAQCC